MMTASDRPTLHVRQSLVRRGDTCVAVSWAATRILLALARAPHRRLTYDAVIRARWPSPAHEPGDPHNVLKTSLCLLRAKLRPFGVDIVTVWGWGFWLPEDLHIDWRDPERRDRVVARARQLEVLNWHTAALEGHPS